MDGGGAGGKVNAVILVGGPSKGTRFRPLSLDNFPKPLFPIAGKEMIYHHINACCSVPGIQEIMLLGFGDQTDFEGFMRRTEAEFGVKIRYLQETTELGTAGGLHKFKEEILTGQPDAVFVLHCDIACSFPLKDMLAFHREKAAELGAIGTLMASQVKKEDAHHYGCLVEDEKHRLRHYAEKPATFVSDLINSGVYCFSPSVWDFIDEVTANLQKEDKLNPVPLRTSINEVMNRGKKGDVVRLEQDVLIPLSEKKQLMVFRNPGFWRQVKHAGSVVYCNELYLNLYAKQNKELLADQSLPFIRGNVIIHPEAQVDETALIGPNVTIGKGVVVGKGVRIMNSIILDNSHIKDHACILYSIISFNCTVGYWSRLEGVYNPSPDTHVNGKRQGICIVGRGSTVAPEIIIRNCIVMPHKDLRESQSDEIVL
ncbi:GMPP [Balamuthia mandrillaris]